MFSEGRKTKFFQLPQNEVNALWGLVTAIQAQAQELLGGASQEPEATTAAEGRLRKQDLLGSN